jgi:hypothetical protein
MRLIVIVLLTAAVLSGWLWTLDSPSVAQTGSETEQVEATPEQEPESETGGAPEKGGEDGESKQDRPTESLRVFVPTEKLPAGSSVSFPVDI